MPSPHGRLLPLSEDGFLINECHSKYINGIWAAATEAAVEAYIQALGPALRSVWLRGSIPRGLGVPGISDLDTLALASPAPREPSPELTQAAEALGRRFPDIAGVELWVVDLSRTQRPDDRRIPALLATQALRVWGEPLAEPLPRLRPGRDMVFACTGLRACLQDALAGLRAEPSLAERQAWLRWIAKALVRAGLEICMPMEPQFTRDLWPCWALFSRHHPQRSEAMRAVMAYAVNPGEQPEAALPLLEELGGWLVERAEATWGP